MDTTVNVIGLDIAKNVFVAVGQDARGKVVWKRTLSRQEVLPTFAAMTATAIGIEACAGSHYWARQLQALGHDTRLIAAQHTRAYVTGNKNDTNDAAAIAEARSRAATKYVPVNTEAQQDLQMLHRARQALMQERVALLNRMRSCAMEYGVVFPEGVARFLKGFAGWFNDENNGLSGLAMLTLRDFKAQLDEKDARLALYDTQLTQAARQDERDVALMEVPGIGELHATALLAAVAD